MHRLLGDLLHDRAGLPDYAASVPEVAFDSPSWGLILEHGRGSGGDANVSGGTSRHGPSTLSGRNAGGTPFAMGGPCASRGGLPLCLQSWEWSPHAAGSSKDSPLLPSTAVASRSRARTAQPPGASARRRARHVRSSSAPSIAAASACATPTCGGNARSRAIRPPKKTRRRSSLRLPT